MKLKYRIILMQAHTYIACFFLPITLLYVATGVLHMFDIEGETHELYQQQITLASGWPQDETEALALISPIMTQHSLGKLPSDYYHEEEYISWYGRTREVLLLPPKESAINIAEFKVIEHSLWHQFLIMHRGYAGLYFWLFGIFLGLSVLISLLSGLIMAVTVPRFKRPAIAVTVLGLLTLSAGFLFGL